MKSNILPTPIDQLLEDPTVRRVTAKRDFQVFFSAYFHNHIEFDAAPFHREFFSLAQDDSLSMAVISAFRGSGKSTILTLAYPLWSVIGVHQKKFPLLISETQHQSRQHFLNLRQELDNNELLKKELGPFREHEDQWGNMSLTLLRSGAKFMAVSREQSIRGLKHQHYRPDPIILDDVEDMNSVRTHDSRQKTYDWLVREVIPAGAPKAKILVIGNILHEESLVMRLDKEIQNKRPGKRLHVPILDSNGLPTWPGRFPSREAVEELRQTIGDERAWMSEYMLLMIPDEAQIIDPRWIQKYDRFPTDRSKYRFTAVGVDPARSTKPWAAHTAMVTAHVFGRNETLRIYIEPHPIDQKLTHLKAIETAKRLDRALRAQNFTPKFFVEDVGYQGALTEALTNVGLPAKGVGVQGKDKAERLTSISHLVQGKKVWFPNEGAETLIGQLVGFDTEKRKDLADAFSLALREILAERPTGEISVGTHPVLTRKRRRIEAMFRAR